MSEWTYDRERACPKCGDRNVSSEYSMGRTATPWRLARIIRQCSNCRFCWEELPLDHDPVLEDQRRIEWANRL